MPSVKDWYEIERRAFGVSRYISQDHLEEALTWAVFEHANPQLDAFDRPVHQDVEGARSIVRKLAELGSSGQLDDALTRLDQHGKVNETDLVLRVQAQLGNNRQNARVRATIKILLAFIESEPEPDWLSTTA